MADLKETDVEKAGKVTWRGARVSRAYRRKEATGRGPDGARDGVRAPILSQFKVRDSLRSKKAGGPIPKHRDRARRLASNANNTRVARRLGLKPNVRKSSAPIEALYAEIEKARPLLARGKDGVRRGTIGGVKVSLGRSGKSNGGARQFKAGTKLAYLDKPHSGNDSARNDTRQRIKRVLGALKSGK